MLAAILGWVGTIGTFVAYAMLWRGRLTTDSLRYAALNAVGGFLGGTAAVLYGAWPSAAANLLWAALGAHSMFNTIRQRRLVPSVRTAPVPAPVPAPLAEPLA